MNLGINMWLQHANAQQALFIFKSSPSFETKSIEYSTYPFLLSSQGQDSFRESGWLTHKSRSQDNNQQPAPSPHYLNRPPATSIKSRLNGARLRVLLVTFLARARKVTRLQAKPVPAKNLSTHKFAKPNPAIKKNQMPNR